MNPIPLFPRFFIRFALVAGLLSVLFLAASCASAPPGRPVGSLPLPPERNEEEEREPTVEEDVTEAELPERETDDDPEVEDPEPAEPVGMHLRHEERVVTLDELEDMDLPENTTLRIVVPPDTPHREVTDLLLQVHEQGYLIELHRMETGNDGN